MAPPQGRSALADVLEEPRLRRRDILGIEGLTQEEILLILDVAARLKAHKFDATQTQFAKGQTLAMLFEKPSLRTRVTFEAGMTQLGGHAIYLEGRLGVRETVPDVARNLDRWVDGIMARTFDHPGRRWNWPNTPASRSSTACPTASTPARRWPTSRRWPSARAGWTAWRGKRWPTSATATTSPTP